MGEVYRAEDTRKHRLVALKLISEKMSGSRQFRERMQREAEIAGRLTEPHVVPIHDYGEIGGHFYLDMRLIEGIDLRTMLNRYGPMDPARAVAVVRQIAAALDAAHKAGVIHRDVKSENVLITGADFAYLVDFGIARAVTDSGMTQPGTTVGTYHYMAPERFTGERVSHSVDIYALACVLHECLTASTPFRAQTLERLITAHLMETPPRPSKLRPGKIPATLDSVIAKGMAKTPQRRYRSVVDLSDAAYEALTSVDQDQVAKIVRASDSATVPHSVPGLGHSGPKPRPSGSASDPGTMRGRMRSGSSGERSIPPRSTPPKPPE